MCDITRRTPAVETVMQSYKARTTGELLRWSGEAQVNASMAVLEGARASLDGRGPGAGRDAVGWRVLLGARETIQAMRLSTGEQDAM